MLAQLTVAVLLGLQGFVSASPLAVAPRPGNSTVSVAKVETIYAVDQAFITSLRPYTFYAGAGYCNPQYTRSWTCGVNCDSTPNFVPVAAGGDGAAVQYWLVGYDGSLGSVIVSRQGTHAENILPVLTDANILLDTLDPDLFPGVPKDVQVHGGFAIQQMLAANNVRNAVKDAMAKYSTTKIALVGHSMGGSLALLDAIHLQLVLPKTTQFKIIGYAQPRTGNAAFANYVDKVFGSNVIRITNKRDPVPILPGRGLGYRHTSGERHIVSDSRWVGCNGQDNTNADCSIGTVPNIFVGSTSDHRGPYDGIKLSTSMCAGEQ